MIQPSLSEIQYGTYTPIATPITNVASASVIGQAGFIKIGNMVTVQGMVTIQATAATTLTNLLMSLPFASNIGSAEHCTGTFGHHAVGVNINGSIYGDFTNDGANLQFISESTTARNMRFHFTYRIV